MTPDSLWQMNSPRSRRIAIRAAGVLLVVISMFLPAVGDAGGNSVQHPAVLPGYLCAYFTLMFMFKPVIDAVTRTEPIERWIQALRFIPQFSCGLINPLLLLALFGKPAWRKPLLILIALLFIDVVYLLAKFTLVPKIGFFLWLAGIVLILMPSFRPKPAMPEISIPAAGPKNL
jgi:predicted membrane-bound dolichyl-phosphate-mannose-protein mannosyltransferase